jgi:trimeric autotransporter adhesin
MSKQATVRCRRTWLPGLLGALLAGSAGAANPTEPSTHLDGKAFFRPDLYLSSAHLPLEEILPQLPNREAWEAFLGRTPPAGGPALHVFVDPRSGAVTNLIGAFPLVPGGGIGNRVTLESLGRRLGRPLKALDPAAVADAVRAFARDHRAVLGLDLAQLGEARAVAVRPDLWQVSFAQAVGGVPVRDARLVATLNSGNLVTLGVETWGQAKVDPRPALKPLQAVEAGFAYADGRADHDQIVREPRLEVVPFAPSEHQEGEAFAGPVGRGYGHRLAWTFAFRRPPEHAQWEVMVDAHTGEVLAFQDINHYAEQQLRGGAYPLTSTEICPSNPQCGTLQAGSPMPFANTGLPAPHNFTNSAGIFQHAGGTVTTTLAGRFVRIVDSCGPISESWTAGFDLGGVNGQHDCTSAGASPGDTSASRSGFYELNKLIEQARGYLPGNAWLDSQLPANMNLNQTCNAFWGGLSVNFYRSGDGCRNSGELAAVFDHEWGHGLDQNDAGGFFSSSSEAYADIAAIYRLQASCVGHGFFWTQDRGCGQTADGTGFNQNEARQGPPHCDLDCSGVRDADWDKHADHLPDTPLGFVCSSCTPGSGPCGRQVHCSAAPVRQAAWDLVARDLPAAPFGLDSQTAFIVGNKLFYQGSGNVGLWHACTCGGSSNGCGSANGYMQWLAADDDNGSLDDGTPHMTAIHAAFDRHQIACATPAPQNSGCGGGPSAAPANLTATPGHHQVALGWSAVAGATRYWVYRTEGFAGCDFGKALIAEVTGTSYTDTQVANGRSYYYNVVAAGISPACYGRASSCVSAVPSLPLPDFTLACSPSALTVSQDGSGASTCTVAASGGFGGAVELDCVGLPAGVSCAYDPGSVTPPVNGSASSALTVAVDGSVAAGSYGFQARGTGAGVASPRTFELSLDVTPMGGDETAVFDPVLRAPRCSAVGRSCDSGASLLIGRHGRGPEPNQPNTLGGTCADGNSGTFHVDESNDRLKVTAVDGSDLAPGETVRIDATVWAWTNPSADRLDLYYAADASSPAWTHLATLTPAAPGAQTLSALYTLPAGALQAVRAQFRYQGSASPCTAGGFNDHDDLIFAVSDPAGPPDNMAAFDAVLQAPRCDGPGRSCNSGSLLAGRATLGPEPNQPNTLAGSCADGTAGAFHSDESLDQLKVSTVDGTALAAGKTVRIEAVVWAWSTPSSDHLDLYFAADAQSPAWTYLTTLTPAGPGAQKLSATYTLPAGPLQAVRGRFRYQGAPAACTTGTFDDHDDLVFAVP